MSTVTTEKKPKNTNAGEKQTRVHPPLAYERFELSTSDFGFTKGEVAFVRKMLQRKYPAVLHSFVDNARELMEVTQFAAVPKLQYEAKLRFNQAGTRAHPNEVLYSPHADKADEGNKYLSTVISIENITQERREAIRQNREEHSLPDGVNKVLAFLEKVSSGESGFSDAIIKVGNIRFPIFATCLSSFLVKFRKEAVVYNFDLAAGDNPHFFLEVGHIGNQNHLLLILFELKWDEPLNLPTTVSESGEEVVEPGEDGLLIIQ